MIFREAKEGSNGANRKECGGDEANKLTSSKNDKVATRQLLNEKLLVQADPKFMLENLSNNLKEYRKENKNQGNSYAQESGEIL